MRAPPLLSLLLAAAAAAATAGCYRSPGAPVENRPQPAAPAGPAPHVEWIDKAAVASGVPAVSAGGATVLFAMSEHDGARGNWSYRFEIRDRRDAVVASHVVLTSDDDPSWSGAAGDRAKLDRQLAAANHWLAEQHAARRFTQMGGLEVERGVELASSFRATGGGVALEWRPSRLTIAQGGRVLLDRATPASWLVEDRPMSGGTCHNPAYLDDAYVSIEHKVALLQISYGGTDTCWEPSDQHHVVAW